MSNEIIDVVKIALEGEKNYYIDDDIEGALLGLMYELELEQADRTSYTISFDRMTRQAYNNLPEFTGF